MESDDGIGIEDEVPLHHQKPFGSGLYRKKVAFVPASSADWRTPDATAAEPPGKSVGDWYLSKVLSKQPQAAESWLRKDEDGMVVPLCDICKQPLSENPKEATATQQGKPRHEASLVHQVCLAHSHPPSSVDRSRLGLSVLESHGWDPDSRQGLGAEGQGIQFPVKPKQKDNTLGLGLVIPKDLELKKKEKPKLLDAKKVRKLVKDERRRTEQLRQQMFGNVDLEKYLGAG